jgi:DNA-binding XRE family transcriptional regulator
MTDDRHAIADALRMCRARSRVTRREASKTVGVTETTMWHWERGDATPRLDQAMALAKLYGCSMSELAGQK